MFFHPASFLFLFFMLLSILIIISSPSWFVIWIALEINMLSFIPLILKKKNKYSGEAALKYFLIQSIASILVIICVILINTSDNYYLMLIIMMALTLKVGAAPLHQWMPSIIEGMNWQTIMMFFVLQKINPLLLLAFCSMSFDVNNLFMYLVIFTSAMVGSIGGLNQISVRKIMVYSSIAHMAWMFSAVQLYNHIWIMYYFIYSLMIICILNIFKNKEIFNLNHLLLKHKMYSILFIICFLSLGGLPPFTGFAPKFILVSALIYENNLFILSLLLLSTFLSLFFYMRILLTNMLIFNSTKMNFYFNFKNKEFINMMNMLGLLTPSLFFML